MKHITQNQRLKASRIGLEPFINNFLVTKEDGYLGERYMLSFWRERNKKDTNTPILSIRQLCLCPLVPLSETVDHWTGRSVVWLLPSAIPPECERETSFDNQLKMAYRCTANFPSFLKIKVINVFRATITSKQDMIQKSPKNVATLKAGKKESCSTSTICPLYILRHLLFCWKENGPTDRLACVSISLSRRSGWTGCHSVPPGVVCDWLLYSPIWRQTQLQSMVQRSYGWQFENIWKRKRLSTNR